MNISKEQRKDSCERYQKIKEEIFDYFKKKKGREPVRLEEDGKQFGIPWKEYEIGLSPILEGGLIIMGINPGKPKPGEEFDDSNGCRNNEPCEENLVYKIGKNSKYLYWLRLYQLFEEIGKLDLLESAFITFLCFIRTHTAKEIKEKKEDIKESLEIHRKIIEYIKPKCILCVGIGNPGFGWLYSKVKERNEIGDGEVRYDSCTYQHYNVCVAGVFDWRFPTISSPGRTIRVIGIPHISGRNIGRYGIRPGQAPWNKMVERLREYLPK